MRPIFLLANHDYEAAADDLCVFNPNRLSNSIGAIGGRFTGWGAIKFTIFSWTLYLQKQIIQKLVEFLSDCMRYMKKEISCDLLIPYLATLWGTTIYNFSFFGLHSLQSIKCFFCTNENSRKWENGLAYLRKNPNLSDITNNYIVVRKSRTCKFQPLKI